MNFVDHARGHTPAKKGDHLLYNVTLYHNVCGKKIAKHWNGYTCEGPCKIGYHPSVMAHFDDDAMATRFHIRADSYDPAEYAIVWKADGKKAYSTLVPLSEAHKYERFTL